MVLAAKLNPVDAHGMLPVGFQAGMDLQPEPTAECDYDQCPIQALGAVQIVVFRCGHSYHISCATTCVPCME